MNRDRRGGVQLRTDETEDAILLQAEMRDQWHAGNERGDITRDFVGPSIDTGFRLSDWARPRRLILSADLAFLLTSSYATSDEPLPLHFSGAQKLRGVVVKDMGRRDSTQLEGPDGEAIQKVPAGKTAPAVQTKQGIEIVAVCATRDIQSTSAARADVENSLYLKQAEGLGKDYLKELRDRAIIEYR